MRLRNIPRAPQVLADHPLVLDTQQIRPGVWREIFGNDRPIRVEIGMGKGKFLLAMAGQNPDVNFVGIEMYSSVLLRAVEKLGKAAWQEQMPDTGDRQAQMPDTIDGQEQRRETAYAKKSLTEAYPNIRFVCADARTLSELFGAGEIDRIYLNFSDPWPKARHSRRRLTSRAFLDLYAPLLKPDGMLEFKTDNRPLFDFSVEEMEADEHFRLDTVTYDLHRDPELVRGNVMTEYEEKFSSRGNPICKLVARRCR